MPHEIETERRFTLLALSYKDYNFDSLKCSRQIIKSYLPGGALMVGSNPEF